MTFISFTLLAHPVFAWPKPRISKCLALGFPDLKWFSSTSNTALFGVRNKRFLFRELRNLAPTLNCSVQSLIFKLLVLTGGTALVTHPTLLELSLF